MKKKLAALDPRIKFAVAGVWLLLLGGGGYTFVVSPQNAETAKLKVQVTAEQGQVYKRRAQLKAGLHPPAIQTADLFRLARAMPDRTDMPGIILTLSDVAREAGINFDLIEPVASGVASASAGSYQVQRIHLLFNGDFYGLSDFLYRLRNLVVVHDGKLEAMGRLFNVDTVTFSVQANDFPKISAELYVNAYVYSSTPPAASTTPTTTTPSADGTSTPPTTTTTDTTATPDSSLPTGATAASGTG